MIKILIAKKSYRFILPPLILALVLFQYSRILFTIFLAISAYFTWFFRDPKRIITPDEKVILAPADGKIISADIDKNELMIRIRMSPFDVHLNRMPIEAKIDDIIPKPGKHKNVYLSNIENINESNLIQIQNERFNGHVQQITGQFARRIECWVKKGDEIQQGEKIGIIRFGSQTNLFLQSRDELVSFKLAVQIGEQVHAGQTILAYIIEDK